MDVSDVTIESVETEEKVSLFRGKAVVSGEVVKFSGIAIYTIGGPTVGVNLEQEDEARLLSKLGREGVDALVAELQRRIVEGDFVVSGLVRIKRQPL
ncbi:MAG: hypothetical protein ACO2O1_01745 [Candidatus Caldarchaeales archaeon]|jgi:hypothetical protein